MKYKILVDYHSEGFKFDDGEFNSVDEAVREALLNCYATPFLIVKVIDWEAKEKEENEKETK